MAESIEVKTRAHDDWVDVTDAVARVVQQDGMQQGAVCVFVPHTTAGIAIQENADPPLREDITAALGRLFPWEGSYGHCEDNAAAHMKAVLVGPSVVVPVVDGRLTLGTWQALYFCEFDGPRRRRLVVQLLPGG